MASQSLLLLLLVIPPLIAMASSSSSSSSSSTPLPEFKEAPAFRNGPNCNITDTIHIAMTLDSTYLRGSLAGVLSVLRHSSCPQSIHFHFLSTHPLLRRLLLSTFPSLPFSLHPFRPSLVRSKISSSLRPALNQPLNYARIYLPHILPLHVTRVIYLDSDLILVDDVRHLWSIPLGPRHVIAAPEHCHANFTSYFTSAFWSHPDYPRVFDSRSRTPCYFNTGVMVMDLTRWREGGYTKRLEGWMEVQKRVARIYELGSLPPFLLVFAGEVKGVEHRWNQHGLGGDNVEGLCRDLHPGPVSLLHWSGKGKPWLRLDAGRPCPLDYLWKPYDLLKIRGGDDGDLLFADG